jgi:hypothetical protein
MGMNWYVGHPKKTGYAGISEHGHHHNSKSGCRKTELWANEIYTTALDQF